MKTRTLLLGLSVLTAPAAAQIVVTTKEPMTLENSTRTKGIKEYKTAVGTLRNGFVLETGAKLKMGDKGMSIAFGFLRIAKGGASWFDGKLKVLEGTRKGPAPRVTLVQDRATGEWLATDGILVTAGDVTGLIEGHRVRIVGGKGRPVQIEGKPFADVEVVIKGGRPVGGGGSTQAATKPSPAAKAKPWDEAVLKAGKARAKELGMKLVPVYKDEQGRRWWIEKGKPNAMEGRPFFVPAQCILVNVGRKPYTVGETQLLKGEYLLVTKEGIDKQKHALRMPSAPTTAQTQPTPRKPWDEALVPVARGRGKKLGYNPIVAYVNEEGSIILLAGSKFTEIEGRWTLVKGDMLVNVGGRPLSAGKVKLQKGEYVLVTDKGIEKQADKLTAQPTTRPGPKATGSLSLKQVHALIAGGRSGSALGSKISGWRAAAGDNGKKYPDLKKDRDGKYRRVKCLLFRSAGGLLFAIRGEPKEQPENANRPLSEGYFEGELAEIGTFDGRKAPVLANWRVVFAK